MHPKNKTGFKSLDKIAADPRVEEVYQDSDGIWVYLVRGYNYEDCSGLRGDTCKDLLERFRDVRDGESC